MRNQTAFKLTQTTQHWYKRINRRGRRGSHQRSVLFITFDGGEQNNFRANLYAEHPIIPLDKTAAMINPNEVEYNSLFDLARNYEESGQLQQAIAAYQKLLKFIL